MDHNEFIKRAKAQQERLAALKKATEEKTKKAKKQLETTRKESE